MRVAATIAVIATAPVLIGCWNREREHYYVLCDGKDGNGWQLIGTEYDGDYLIACTYQVPWHGSGWPLRRPA